MKHLEKQVKDLATQFLDSINLYELEKRSPDFSPIGSNVFQELVVTAGSDRIKEYLMEIVNAWNDNDALPIWDTVESDSEYRSRLQATVLDLDNDLMTVKSRLIGPPLKLDVISIIGMEAIGKKTLARMAYDDIYMEHHFYFRAWITVSQMHQQRGMLLDILRCFSLVNDNTYLKSTEQLAEQVYRSLKGRRYLIAMDDMWDTNAWDVVKRSFPDEKNGSRMSYLLVGYQMWVHMLAQAVLLITCGALVWNRACSCSNLKLFGSETFPLELEKATKQIVDKCQGLPLAIAVVAGFCSKISKMVNCWENVAHKIGLVVSRTQKNAWTYLC